MSSVQIDAAEAVDLPDITRLYIHLSGYQRSMAPDAPRFRVDDTGWEDYARKKFDDPRAFLFVAREGDEIVGFVGTALADKPWGTSYEILTLIVDEGRRGRGIGTALLRHAEAHAAEVKADGLRVDVLLHNPGARAFYERAGYSPTSVRHAKPVPREVAE
jgi:ribosomal protein S18 acetylase RimI-like enzyme